MRGWEEGPPGPAQAPPILPASLRSAPTGRPPQAVSADPGPTPSLVSPPLPSLLSSSPERPGCPPPRSTCPGPPPSAPPAPPPPHPALGAPGGSRACGSHSRVSRRLCSGKLGISLKVLGGVALFWVVFTLGYITGYFVRKCK